MEPLQIKEGQADGTGGGSSAPSPCLDPEAPVGIAPRVHRQASDLELPKAAEVFISHTWDCGAKLGIEVESPQNGLGVRVSKVTDMKAPKEIEGLVLEAIEEEVVLGLPYDEVLEKVKACGDVRPLTLSFTSSEAQVA